MGKGNYLKGRRKEYELKKNLEEAGFTVLRSAGSHGFADLVAINEFEVWFIQVKPNKMSEGLKTRLETSNEWVNKDRCCKYMVM